MRNKKGRGEDRVDPEVENEEWKLLRTWGIPICYGCNLNSSWSLLAATAKMEHDHSRNFLYQKEGTALRPEGMKIYFQH